MKKRNKIALIILGVVIFAILSLQTPIMSGIRETSWNVWINTVGQFFRVGPLTVKNNVREQMERLVAENARLKNETMECQKTLEQTTTQTFKDFKKVHARIAPRPIDTFHSRYIINRGTKDGINIGAPVVTRDSVLIGFVTELNNHTSVLQLLTHPDTSLPANIIQEENTIKGLVKGKSFTSVEMVTIPKDQNISTGQKITSAYQEKLVPAGLLIGQINEVVDEEYKPYQKARITLPYDSDKLIAVTVLTAE